LFAISKGCLSNDLIDRRVYYQNLLNKRPKTFNGKTLTKENNNQRIVFKSKSQTGQFYNNKTEGEDVCDSSLSSLTNLSLFSLNSNSISDLKPKKSKNSSNNHFERYMNRTNKYKTSYKTITKFVSSVQFYNYISKQ
jgi:hypothetical protein